MKKNLVEGLETLSRSKVFLCGGNGIILLCLGDLAGDVDSCFGLLEWTAIFHEHPRRFERVGVDGEVRHRHRRTQGGGGGRRQSVASLCGWSGKRREVRWRSNCWVGFSYLTLVSAWLNVHDHVSTCG
jgi:hypothetical protein